MSNLKLWELLGHNLGDDLSPQTRGSEDVGFIERPDWKRRVVLEGKVCCEAGDSLNLWARVWLGVPGSSITVVLLSLTKVDTASQLADDVEVYISANIGLQWGDIDKGFRGKVAWPKVSVGAHLLAKSKDTLLWSDLSGSPFWTSNGSEKNSVGGLSSFESFVREGLAMGINRALWIY